MKLPKALTLILILSFYISNQILIGVGVYICGIDTGKKRDIVEQKVER
jgi:hypothetical protein